MATQSSSLEKIQELESQIRQLKDDAVLELKEKLISARRAVSDLEKELEELTGKAAPTGIIRLRARHETISDEDLKPRILEIFALNGKNGMNAKNIAEAVGQAPVRIREFLKKYPKVLKRQGTGPGTKFFLP